MRLLISYLKEKLPVVGVYAVMLVIFCILFWLKEVPFDVIEYGAELSAIWLLFVGALNFWFYRKRYQSLLDLSAALPHELKEFPDPKSRIEAEYQEITETIFAWREMLENEVLLSKKDASDYYSLWVHQIKTPISAMRLLLQREEQKQTDPDETAGMEKSVLYDMQQELFWINQYVNMALQYQRMNSGMNDLVLEMVSADQVVRTAIRRFALIMIRKKIAIHYEECREMVLSDEKWLEFVVEQILSNAIKYSGENRAVTIQINRNEADNTCELVISDQGIGIRKEDLPRIFEKGYTGYNGRADKTSTGIGLYLCREITKKLGHGIMITSEIGKGTDVTIVFERNNLDVRD